MPQLTPGRTRLGPAEAHHLRDVLRLAVGDEVEAFDAEGTNAAARILYSSADGMDLQIDALQPAPPRIECAIASAIPKGSRADWMIEKLSELGIGCFIPLTAERSVVLPSGKNKADRWRRIATEAARQSRRRGVMRIDNPTDLQTLLTVHRSQGDDAGQMAYLSTLPDAIPAAHWASQMPGTKSITLLIGPEGGWTDREKELFNEAALTPIGLGQTVLRVETAAVAAAVVLGLMVNRGKNTKL